MPKVKMKEKIQFLFYRISTILKSLKVLYTLSPEKVQAFLSAYHIYDHDWADVDAMRKEMGENYYQEIKKKLVDYYSVLNHLCSIGQVEKMYIPPAMDLSKSIIKNQALFEEKMSRDLDICKGQKVLDIGCGRGLVACHVASLTGAQVIGINIDADQLESAKRFAKGKGLSDRCQFIQGDLNEIPFPFRDNFFDSIYNMQVFTYSKDLVKLFKDLYRLLKPGGKISCLDWVRLPAYDPENSQHADLMKRIKPLIAAVGTPSSEEYLNAMKEAGFEILIDENASIDGLQAPLIENADKFFTRMTRFLNFLVRCKILPKHFQVLFDRLTKDGEAFVEADRLRLVTTCYHIVGRKKA